MGIGVSVVLMAIGAILAFAVELQSEAINLNAVGVILLVAGAIGMLSSLLFWTDTPIYRTRRRRVVETEPTVVERSAVHPSDGHPHQHA